MERHNWRPIYVHAMSLEGSYLCEATHAQLELFYSLPPDVQAKVFLQRLEGYARLNQAARDGDHEGMEAHGHWSGIFSDYDDQRSDDEMFDE